MNIMLQPLEKYAIFTGRARRKEYWLFYLLILIISIPLQLIHTSTESNIALWLYIGFYLAVLLPSLAVTVRRLHDTDRSGGWVFMLLIPIVGGIWIFILMLLRGTEGSNRFGPNPISPEDTQ